MLVLLVWILMNTLSVHSDDYCETAFSCAGKWNIYVGSHNIYLYGYKSGAGTSTGIVGDVSYLYGFGGFAGYSIGRLSAEFIYGAGSHSFSFANLISLDNNVGTDLGCRGVSACSNTEIITDSSNMTVNCVADYGCYESTFRNITNMYGAGSYSLMNSIIYGSSIDDTVSIYLYGYNAGYNLTIYGTTSNTINLYCGGNGCNGTVINCNATKTICNIYCNLADSDACPTEAKSESPPALTSQDLLFDSDTMGMDFDSQCNTSENSLYTFDDFQDDDVTNTMIIYNNSLCCRGAQACINTRNVSIINGSAIISGANALTSIDGTKIIVSIETATVDNNNNNGIIYCAGAKSCQNTILYSNNIIYCGGYEACINSTFYNAYKLYCGAGSLTCNNGRMYGIENIYITSKDSAENSVIYSNNNGITMNIYLMGCESGNNINVYCNESDHCNIYCMTAFSCNENNTIINCINNNCIATKCSDNIGGTNTTCPQINNNGVISTFAVLSTNMSANYTMDMVSTGDMKTTSTIASTRIIVSTEDDDNADDSNDNNNNNNNNNSDNNDSLIITLIVAICVIVILIIIAVGIIISKKWKDTFYDIPKKLNINPLPNISMQSEITVGKITIGNEVNNLNVDNNGNNENKDGERDVTIEGSHSHEGNDESDSEGLFDNPNQNTQPTTLSDTTEIEMKTKKSTTN